MADLIFGKGVCMLSVYLVFVWMKNIANVKKYEYIYR